MNEARTLIVTVLDTAATRGRNVDKLRRMRAAERQAIAER